MNHKEMLSNIMGLFTFPDDIPFYIKQCILEFSGLLRFGKRNFFYIIYN